MKIAVPCEVHANESRVATTPVVVQKLIALGFEVEVESQAGVAASFSDASYIESGATIEQSTELVLSLIHI